MDHVEHRNGGTATSVGTRSTRAARRRPTEHGVFAVLLVMGVAVRVSMAVAFHPMLERTGAGVDAALANVIVDLQHLAGVAAASGLYFVVVRWGAWRWLAALASVPAFLDAHILRAEQVLGPMPLVGLLVAAALVSLCWRSRPRLLQLLVAGLCASAATVLLLEFGGPLTGLAAPAPRVIPLADALVRDVLVMTVPGPLLVIGFVLALGAVLGLGRARGSSMRVVCALTAGVPLVAVLGTMTRFSPSWGDTLAAVSWWPAAGAVGLTALLRGRRGRATHRPQSDAVDRAARDDFHRRHGAPRLGPVAIVIAAYNEADGLPGVLAGMSESVCGLAADVLVVDDGSSDGTAAAIEGTRALTVACPVNRGQGAALRLGYALAREHGARYVITTDADGQYDVDDFPAVLTPLLEGRADFVTGSRILGGQHTHDRVRRLGVHVFAWVASAFAGRWLTDTSFGLRAMRAEVPAALTLNQPQYQSSELLLGVLSHGFEVLEVPATMHLRAAGSSKKGRNLVYGARYARVVVGTWWREGCLTPAPHRAAALRDTREHAAG